MELKAKDWKAKHEQEYLFLICRVELKVNLQTLKEVISDGVPNLPCGVESPVG